MSITRLVAVSAAVVCVTASAGAASAAPPEQPTGLTCESCLLVDDRGSVLFARDPDRPLPNASTTKMVTALIVVRATDLDADVPVSAEAAATGGGGLDLQPGDVYSAEDLLYALLLDSSNDAAVALAEHVAGSQDAFVSEMNELASALGADHTHFVTAHGLDAPGHYSTASDLARVARALLGEAILARIVRTADVTISGRGGTERIDNRNVLLEAYPGMIGVKTGYTLGAGEVLVGAARRRSRELIAVAMRSDDAARDVRRLLDYGFDRLSETVLVRTDAAVGAVVFDSYGAVPVVPASDIRGLGDPGRIEVDVEASPAAAPPLAEGERVGTVVVRQGGRRVASGAAVASRAAGDDASAWVAHALAALIAAVGALLGRGG